MGLDLVWHDKAGTVSLVAALTRLLGRKNKRGSERPDFISFPVASIMHAWYPFLFVLLDAVGELAPLERMGLTLDVSGTAVAGGVVAFKPEKSIEAVYARRPCSVNNNTSKQASNHQPQTPVFSKNCKNQF